MEVLGLFWYHHDHYVLYAFQQEISSFM